jgi:hypothetical protein
VVKMVNYSRKKKLHLNTVKRFHMTGRMHGCGNIRHGAFRGDRGASEPERRCTAPHGTAAAVGGQLDRGHRY